MEPKSLLYKGDLKGKSVSFNKIFIVFLVLKLTGVITWSWWWITFPIWIIPAIVVSVFIGVGLLIALAWVIRKVDL